MGACFQMFSCKAESAGDAVEQCYSYIDNCKWNHGHGGYSGTMAECDGAYMTDKTFGDSHEAEDWLEENAEKWGPAIGVRVNHTEKGHYYLFGAICSE